MIRRFIKAMLPEHIAAFLKRLFRAPSERKSDVDPRRYWLGEDVASPEYNVPIFTEAGQLANCRTFSLESRDSICVSDTVELKLGGKGQLTCRIGVAGVAGAGIEGSVNGKPVFHVREIGDGHWHDLRFDINAPAVLTLKPIGGSRPVVSHPILTKLDSASSTATTPKNVIVVLLDSIAADLLELYRVRHGAESWIHRYFESGASYTNAFSQSEWTYPSVYSLMTGKLPLGHGCFERFLGQGLAPDATGTLAQEMTDRGFVTVGFSTSKMYHPGYNAHLGFRRFFYQKFGFALSFPVITKHALAHLEAHRDCRNFMFLDYIDLHAPWSHNTEITDSRLPLNRIADANKEYDSLTDGEEGSASSDAAKQQLIERCVARTRDVDLSLDSLFNYLERTGQAENSIVLLLADHGDLFRRGKQPLLCRSRTHVPFMIRGPGVAKGEYHSFVSAAVDVMPTLLHLVDGSAPQGPGRRVPPFDPPRDFVISDSQYERVYQAAVRTESHVYHFSCGYYRDTFGRVRFQLPGEQKLFLVEEEEDCRDVASTNADVVKNLHARLSEYLAPFHVG